MNNNNNCFLHEKKWGVATSGKNKNKTKNYLYSIRTSASGAMDSKLLSNILSPETSLR